MANEDNLQRCTVRLNCASSQGTGFFVARNGILTLVNQANFNRTNLITPELLQASIHEAFTSGQPYFTNIWTEFTGTNSEEIALGQELLLQLAKTDYLISINTPIAEKVLTRLLRYHILQEINGKYDFEIPLFKQWVRERAVKS